MNLRPIIDEIASQAEDFLKGITDRQRARAELTEFIALDYAGLSLDEGRPPRGRLRFLDETAF